MQFENIVGLYALLALVPLIVLYLMRPKPKKQIIPSLMFLTKNKKNLRKSSFLRKFIRNLVFFIQFLAITLLALAVASPYFPIKYDVGLENTVLIIDASASMQTKHGLGTRFSKAVEIAKQNLKGKVTIILAENTPVVALEHGTKAQAIAVLNKLVPKATSTNLGDAILLAVDILKGKRGKVVVLSDFITTDGPDIMIAKKSLVSKGNFVDFVDLSTKANNVGFVDLSVTGFDTTAYIKNFNDKSVEVEVELINNGKVVNQQKLTLGPKSIGSIVFATPPGISRLKLIPDDDFVLDNNVYVSMPEKRKISTLLVTNAEKSAVISALQASKDIELTIANPPIIPAFNYDVVVFHGIEVSQILPGTTEDLKRYLNNGGNLIISAQKDLPSSKLSALLPVTLISIVNRTTHGCVKVFGELFPKENFEREPCFTVINLHYRANTKNNTIALMRANEDNAPLLAVSELGNGRIYYYGIFDEESDFPGLNFYPIFWHRLLHSLVKIEDIDLYNRKTGVIESFHKQLVKTPSESIVASNLLIDEVGIYEFNNRKVAVNLLNELESDVSLKSQKRDNIHAQQPEGSSVVEENFNLSIAMLVVTLLLLLFEIYYIKRRGDI